MSVKRSASLFILIFSLLFCTHICHAADEGGLLQGYTWENYADLYISGEINTGTVTVDVSNQPAEIVDGGLLTDKDVTVCTTLLLDVSASMPKGMRSNVIDYINNYIEKLNGNEQLKVVAFGEEVTVLQDFTADRYNLSKAVSEIKFEGQQSMLYDAVYNTMPKIGVNDVSPCYYRTIVITDGVDESVSGITKEELYLKLRESFYPVEVIAVSDSENHSIEKDLTALTRISGGRCLMMHPGEDAAALTLGVDGITWIRIKIPNAVLDGSIRQFNIKDNTGNLQFDFKVPIFASNPEPIEDKTEEAEQKENAASAGEQDSSAENTAAESDDSKSLILIYAAIAGVVIAVIAAAAIIIILLSKKRKPSSERRKDNPQPDGGMTEIAVGETGIRIRQIDDPDRVWNLMLSETIQVGRRESCQVFLDESSVSRQQCVIYADSTGLPVIENQSNSNPTKVNTIKITAPQRLYDGDQIKCGRVVLMVDSITIASSSGSRDINKMTEFVNV